MSKRMLNSILRYQTSLCSQIRKASAAPWPSPEIYLDKLQDAQKGYYEKVSRLNFVNCFQIILGIFVIRMNRPEAKNAIGRNVVSGVKKLVF